MASGDVQQMVQILQALNGNDNTQRKQAEQMYEQVKAANPGQLAGLLVQILGTLLGGEHDSTRHYASVFLWKLVRRQNDGESVFSALPEEQQNGLRSGLLQVLNAETAGVVRRKLAETCGELGCVDADWPALFQAIFEWAAGASAQKETALRVLRPLAEEAEVAELLMQEKQKMAALMQASLADPCATVRCQAILLVLAFVEADVEKKTLKQLLPTIVGQIQALAGEKKEPELQEVLKELIALIEDESAWFKDAVPQLFETMVQIAKAKDQLDDPVRRLGLEFLVSYAEKKPKQCTKLGAVNGLFELAMQFMLELEEDCGWETHDDEDDEDESNCDAGMECVDRLAKAFGAEQLPGTALQLVQQFMGQTWKHKVVALMTLSQLAETVEDEAQVDGMIQLYLQSLKDPHARVRYASMSAIAQTATDQTPYVPEKHGSSLLPLLIGMMDDPVDRCKVQACSAFVNLGEEMEQEVMLAQLPTLMQKLSQLLALPNRHVREEAITAVAVIAGNVEEHFKQYYQVVVPGLKQIVQTASSKEERKLRGKAFECISIIGLSVGKETFAPDVPEVMQAMVVHLQAIGANPAEMGDDPQKSYIEDAIERVCRAVKKDFVSFVPPLLQICAKGLATQATKLTRDEVEDEDQSVAFLKDGSCTGLKTSQVEDIKACISMVQVFVEELEEAYAEHIESTQVAVFQLLDFAHDNEIRELALKTWSGLMRASRKTFEARQITDTSALAQMLRNALMKVLAVIQEETDCEEVDIEQVATLSEGLAKCIEEGPEQSLTGFEVGTLVTKCTSLIEESCRRRDAHDKKKKKGKVDEDEEEELQKQKEQEEELRGNVLQITGKLMQKQSKAFLEANGQQQLGMMLTFLFGSKKDGDDRLAALLACDFLEFLPEHPATLELFPTIMQKLLAGAQDLQDDELRQASAFGIGLAAALPAFAAHAGQVATTLGAMIEHPKSKKKAAKTATENLVSALGAICDKQAQAVQPQHWELWLQRLPLTADEEEGQKAHALLLKLLAAQHPVFQDPKRVSRGLEVLATVYKSDAVTEETNKGTVALFAQVGAQLDAMSASWSDKAKTRTKRIVRDAQSGK